MILKYNQDTNFISRNGRVRFFPAFLIFIGRRPHRSQTNTKQSQYTFEVKSMLSLLAPAAKSHIEKHEDCNNLTESALDGQDRTSREWLFRLNSPKLVIAPLRCFMVPAFASATGSNL